MGTEPAPRHRPRWRDSTNRSWRNLTGPGLQCFPDISLFVEHCRREMLCKPAIGLNSFAPNGMEGWRRARVLEQPAIGRAFHAACEPWPQSCYSRPKRNLNPSVRPVVLEEPQHTDEPTGCPHCHAHNYRQTGRCAPCRCTRLRSKRRRSRPIRQASTLYCACPRQFH